MGWFRNFVNRYVPSPVKHGGNGNDTLIGYMPANWLYGGGGNDRLYAYGAYNYLDGGTGDEHSKRRFRQ